MITKEKGVQIMKKLVSILLALIMVLGLTMGAYAATNIIQSVDATSNTDTGTVSITFQSGTNTTVYYVTVDWSSLEFKYQEAGTGTWDPTEHKYTAATTAGWVASTDESVQDQVTGENNNTITRTGAIVVANHSNAAVVVSATFANGTAQQQGTGGNAGVTASLSVSAPTTLGSATEHMNAYDDAEKVSYDLVVSGTPTESAADFGTITVKITAG